MFAENFVKGVLAPETFRDKPEIVELIRATIESNPVTGIAGTLLALASRTDTTASLPSIRVPTLILVGEHDTATPVEAARSLQQRIGGSRLVVVPHAGHLSTLENPAVCNRAIMEFLAQLDKGRGVGKNAQI